MTISGELDRCSGGRGMPKAYLLVLELDQGVVVSDDLIAEILTSREEYRETIPLTSHFIPIIGINKLIIVHASCDSAHVPISQLKYLPGAYLATLSTVG